MKLLLFIAITCCITILSHAQEQTRYQRRLEKENAIARKNREKEEIKQRRIEEALARYKYPTDSLWNICYQKQLNVPYSKEFILKRVRQFIATQDFEKAESIKCKEDNAIISTKIFDKSVLYEDMEEGKVIGRGYFPFCYVNLKHCVVVFKYKIQVKDSCYRYQFYDFNVVEFMSGEKTKVKGGGAGFAYGGSLFTSSSGTATFNAANIRQVPLETFMLSGEYYKTSHDKFKTEIRRIINNLKATITETF